MKLVEETIILNEPGSVKIILEETDDLWLTYNLISVGDIISTETSRKVHHPSDSGKKSATRIKLKLEIKITSVDFDRNSSLLRVRGKTINSNEHVTVGAFHTLEVEKNKAFDLKKKIWDSTSIDSLRDGCSGTTKVDLAVLLFSDSSAHLYLVGNKATNLCAKIHAKAVVNRKTNVFFEDVLSIFRKHVDFNIVRSVVVGSPDSVKDEFHAYMLSGSHKVIEAIKSRIFVVTTSSKVPKEALKEVLGNSTVMDMIKNGNVVMKLRAFKELTKMISTNSDRACYGTKSVETAHELEAIDTLLIIDNLFKSADIAMRQKYVSLVKSIKNAGGKAYVFSPMHVSGEQLAQLTGIAAILRFPLPDLEEMEL